MMAVSPKKSKYLPDLDSLGFYLLAIPVAAAVIGSLWLSASAAYENIKFARSTDQILQIISIARDAAGKNPQFGQQMNEDILETLVRQAQLPANPVNSWNGDIRLVALPPNLMRFETDLPSRSCRRIGSFFGKEAEDVSLQVMEAREGNGIWRQFYNASNANGRPPSVQAVHAACGKAEYSSIALTVRLR